MRLGEAGKVQQLESSHVVVIVSEQRGKNILAGVVPRASGRMRMTCSNYLELWKGRIRNEFRIRINVNVRRMIDSEQPRMVKIVDLFHRLGKRETQATVAYFHAIAVNSDVFIRIGKITLLRRDPVSEHGSADHVADHFVGFSSSRDHHRTRTAAA